MNTYRVTVRYCREGKYLSLDTIVFAMQPAVALATALDLVLTPADEGFISSSVRQLRYADTDNTIIVLSLR